MIKHIFKIIWNERKTNSWIILEYVLVFCILWFCCDYLYYMGKRYYEPLGFNTEHVYTVNMFEKEQSGDTSEKEEITPEDNYAYALTLLDRLKQYPGVENASISSTAVPYTGSSSIWGFLINSDSIIQSVRYREVTSGFFDVFKIQFIKGTPFEWTDPASEKQVVIAGDQKSLFGNIPVSDVHSIRIKSDDPPFQIIGITEKVKNTFFNPYLNSIYRPLNKAHISLTGSEIAIRVQPNADKDFEERFVKEMREQLAIGPYMLAGITSLKDMKQKATELSGNADNMNSVYSITLFLIINIFLGIIGTFWYRTESRKSEIGLRIALGSSKAKIKTLLYMETLVLLTISATIGVNICVNIGQSDLLNILGIPQSDPTQSGSGMEQYLINFGITFLFLAVVSLLAVWYPAKQSSDIQPAEALHDE